VTKKLVIVAALAAMVCGSTRGTAVAQEQEPSSPTNPKKVQNIPLELQVVISRYQGEKRISSLPYVLSLKSYVNSIRGGGTGASLRLGSRVPIRQQTFVPAADGKPATTTGSVTYENVGTNIDAGASALVDGRFEVTVSINESSVVTDPQDLKATPGSDSYPVFRSYQSTNTLFVKEGQTVQFTAAADRVSGEVVRVEVKLTVVK
jgi:Bacterial type II and III secretion system protein